MSFFHQLINLRLFNNLKSSKAEKRILSEKAFRQFLERERARSDRYGGVFSLLVFDIGNSNGNQPKRHAMAEILLNRVRPTDEVGRFEKYTLGVALPSTTNTGALKLADDICQKILARKQQVPSFEVYTYPAERMKKIDKKSENRYFGENECVVEGLSETSKPDDTVGECKQLAQNSLPLFGQKLPAWKRGIDILGSIMGLLILWPLFLTIAISIKFISPGPILFKQRRVGYLGRPFTLFKFRTMKVNADKALHENHVAQLIQEGKPLKKMDAQDPRIFPLGKFLRLTGMDELPQLINILFGQMSLVGPRPELACSLQYCESWHIRRFETKPGLSGLWQVSGKTKTTFNEMMRLDISYIKKRSFWLDVLIMLKTIPKIFSEARR
jgi:lipopolysaccharide/colanic/teichoic acid biosynthesis glycosyltransferase/GGDEF domain-containing protein